MVDLDLGKKITMTTIVKSAPDTLKSTPSQKHQISHLNHSTTQNSITIKDLDFLIITLKITLKPYLLSATVTID